MSEPEPLIRQPLRCVQCGYDLEGLSARGNCPECGREIVSSLAKVLDLSAPGEPAAQDSRRLALALALATAGCLAGTARLPEFALLAGLEELDPAEGIVRRSLIVAASAFHATALVGTAIGLIAMAFVLPRRNERRVLRVRVLGCVGFALWLSLSAAAPNLTSLTVTAIPAAMTLLALSPVFRELGPRSRVYRDRDSAKQRIDELLLALGIAGCTSAGAIIASNDVTNETLVALLRLMAAASAGLLAIGLGYLTVNAAWILRSVLRPDPTLVDLFGRPDRPNPDANPKP